MIGQVRLVHQSIGQSKSSLQLPKKRRKKRSDNEINARRFVNHLKIFNGDLLILTF